ncbi:MAG: MFS transporter [bacterium]
MSSEKKLAGEHPYAWVILGVAAVMSGMGFGAVVNISVFLQPLAAEFGWARGNLSLAYSVATIGAGLGGIVMGHFSDRLPVRRVVLFGALMPGVAFFLLSRLNTQGELFLYHAIIGLLGFGAIMVPVTFAVTNWFSLHRGLAVGLASAGGALGQGLMPLLARQLILDQGWRGAYFTMGVIYLLVLLPLALLLRNPPAAPVGEGSAAEAENPYALPREKLIALLCLAVVFCCIAMATPIVHVIPLGSDLGLGPRVSAGLLTAMMVFGMFGRVLAGQLADRWGNLRIYIATSFAQTALALWFPAVASLAGLYLLSSLFGLGYAGVMTALILCARQWAPPGRTGFSLGLVAFFGWTGMAVGGWQGGLFFDLTGNYSQAFLNSSLAGVVNLAILALLYHYTVRKPARLAGLAAAA